MRTPKLLMASMVAGLAACASPEAGPTAPPPVPTPRPVPQPALLVTTAVRSYAQESNPAQVAVYTIGPDGRLALTAPPQAVGSLARVYAASYTPSTGVFRQAVSASDDRYEGPTTLVTYAVDVPRGAFTRLGTVELPRRSVSVGLHPGGRFLYASVDRQVMDAYELDPQGAAILRAIPGAPFTWNALTGASDFTFAPSGRLLWAHGRVPDGYHGINQFVLSFAVDPATGALRTTDETPVLERMSSLAVAAGEDVAYLVDRSNWRLGRFTWRLFNIDGAGALSEDEPWGGDYVGGLHFTRSGRFLLSVGDDNSLSLLERAADGRAVLRTAIGIPVSGGWEVQRTLLQVGDFVYLGGDRTLAVVRLDESARTLTLVQEVTPGDDLQVLSVALALPAP